jgi:hypothetical protein
MPAVSYLDDLSGGFVAQSLARDHIATPLVALNISIILIIKLDHFREPKMVGENIQNVHNFLVTNEGFRNI